VAGSGTPVSLRISTTRQDSVNFARSRLSRSFLEAEVGLDLLVAVPAAPESPASRASAAFPVEEEAAAFPASPAFLDSAELWALREYLELPVIPA
jgi:hypothetical protein